jgi:hypothetical protein
MELTPPKRHVVSRQVDVLALLAVFAACTPVGQTRSPEGGAIKPAPQVGAEPNRSPPAAESWQVFDRVVTAESLFPDPAQRALYRVLPVESVHGRRVYGFTLVPQAGMQENRHFHIIAVAVLPRGADAGSASAFAGPNGGFSEYVQQTTDGRYELRVSEGMLLPDTVELPPFDAPKAAQGLSNRYDSLKGARE